MRRPCTGRGRCRRPSIGSGHCGPSDAAGRRSSPDTASRWAVVLDAAEYRRLTGERRTLADVLLAVEPLLDDDAAAVFDGIEAERKRDRLRNPGFAE